MVYVDTGTDQELICRNGGMLTPTGSCCQVSDLVFFHACIRPQPLNVSPTTARLQRARASRISLTTDRQACSIRLQDAHLARPNIEYLSAFLVSTQVSIDC